MGQEWRIEMSKLDDLMKDVNKKFKEEIMSVGLNSYDYARIPFTSPRMNYCTFGGIPVNKITEFYGEEHGGKTTTALDVVANYQHMDDAKHVLYVDAENRLDVEWASKLGVDIDSMYIIQPKEQTAEDIFQMIYDAVCTGEVGLWILDSIGALLSQQEFEKEIAEKTYGGVSLPLTRFGKLIIGAMSKYKCTGIAINQLRDDMNSQWGGTRTVGGRGWKFYCSVRLQFSRGQFIDDKGNKLTRSAENPAGNIVLMSMTKNSTCAPTRRTGFYTLKYAEGIDYLTDLIDVAIKYGIIDQSGAWYKIIDVDTGEVIKEKIQGQSKLREILSTDINICSVVEQLVDKCMQVE